VRRTAEVWIAGVSAVLTTLLLGAFAVVINGADERLFAETLHPLLAGGGSADVPVDAAYEAARTLGAWFGMTVVVVLGLTAVGIAVARRRPARRRTGWWFLAAGLVCLGGSQLLLYPVAFGFFVSAGLFALRKPDHQPENGSTR
jgi:uncharacterized membrane protein YhaH (DUF805 family)